MTSQLSASTIASLETPAVKPRASKQVQKANKTQKPNGEPESIPMLRIRTDGVSYGSGSSGSSDQRLKVNGKFPSMDSGVSNRYRSTESEGSSPASFLRCLRALDDVLEAEYPTTKTPCSQAGDDIITTYNDVNNTKERYKTTASDRDADMEVSEILSSESNRNSANWQYGDNNNDVMIDDVSFQPKQFRNSLSSNSVSSPKNLLLRHRREVGDVVRLKERHPRRQNGNNVNSLYPIDDTQCVGNGPITARDYIHRRRSKSPSGISSGPGSSRPNSALTLSDIEIERANDVSTGDVIKNTSSKKYHTVNDKLTKSASSIEANAGVSSNDTHHSSVRYEPVTDRSCTPPSPGRHGSRHRLLGSNKHRSPRMTDDDITDEDRRRDSRDDDVGDDDDDIASMDDVIRAEELRPLNSRRRMSSPVVIEPHVRDQYRRESSSILARTNSGTVYVTKAGPTTLPIEPRHQMGLPRMGTGLPPSGSTSQNTVPHGGTPNLYKPQKPNSLVTSRLPTSQTEQFDPVVMTTLKPTHEADQSGWNYVGSPEVRSPYPFSSGVSPPHRHSVTTPSGEDTAARFMSKRPSIANAYNPTRHIGNSQFDSTGFKCFKNKFSSRCSWKCAAITFILFTILLVALVAYFLVQSLAASPLIESDVSCLVTKGPTGNAGVTVVNGNTAGGPEIPFEIQLGRKARFSVPAGMFWRSLVFMGSDDHLKFNFTISRRAVLGVYGRKGIRPTHTKFDFFEKIDGSSIPVPAEDSSSSRRKKREIQDSVTMSFVKFLGSGSWHLGVYNDGEENEEGEIATKLAGGLSSCLNNCNGNGDCVDGVCNCFPRFHGRDCAEESCPIVCSGRGLYAHGECVCFSGWKGKDCATPTDQCEVADCSGRGTCGTDGECACDPGWAGIGCEIVTCIPPNCSDHGVCVDGVCHCDRGWKGKSCDVEDSGCFEKCSGHGTYSNGQCLCNPGWSGRTCSQAPCLPTCHPEHGSCISGSCQCNEGWTGPACDERMCHSRCYEHGTCSNGKCVCNIGWNGDMCTFEGCPNNCGSHGHCSKNADGEWFCSCQHGWKGQECDIQVEMECTDGRDNDRDTLIDCHDPDCCENPSCKSSQQCRGASDPAQVIQREVSRTKHLPPPSFHDSIKFLIKSSSNVQFIRSSSAFNPEKTSVLRGKVVTLDGSPLVGVKVQIKDRPGYGYTKSRRDGMYDIIVNGGGSVTLNFERSLLLTTSSTIFVPLGDFVIVPTVTMRTASQPEQLKSDVTIDGAQGNCDVSVFPRPRAIILPMDVQAFTADNCDDRGSVIPETQAVRETIALPFSGVDLVYLSSRTSGYKSKIDVQLTPLDVATNLRRVHLRISIQGILLEKMFEPIPELKYSFIWSRQDAYGQKVYGTVTAKIEVGYEYEMCPSVVWDYHLTAIKGHDPVMTQEVGGWSLNIHHTYHNGVVHLGNGGTMQLDRQPPMMSTVMGTGLQRHSSCDGCNGPASSAKLLAPVSLACDAFGSVYVGDYNYIRKIDRRGHVSSLLFLRNPPHKYYMAVSPSLDGTLYYSDPNGKRVYKIRNMNPQPRGSRRILSAADLSTNMEVLAGTGATCLPLVQGNCGDGGPAYSAKLSAPRGLAVDKTGRVYFIDGTMIRVVETSGTIQTFAGSNNMAASRPLPCEGTISLSQLQFDFPTDLSINPYDDSIHVLDSNIVIKIDVINKQASLLAGVPVHCTRKASKNWDERDSRRVSLVSPVAIVASPHDGSIYIAEADNQFVNRVRRVDTYRLRISTIAGAETSCDCQMSDCNCFKGDGDFARSARLNTPAALAAAPNGSIYIADQLNLRIRKLSSALPKLNNQGKYRIANPDTNHVYVFSRDGLHLTTQNVITGTSVYNFTYSPEGSVDSIMDIHGNRLSIIRDGNNVPNKILLPNTKVLQLQFTASNALQRITEGYSPPLATMSYQGGGATLLQSITQGRSQSSFYVYNVHGRLISAVSPSGGVTTLHVNANATTHTVTMTTAATSVGNAEENQRGVGSRGVIITTQPGFICDIVTTQEGEMTAMYQRWTDNSISVHFLDGSDLSLETKPHPVLGLTAPFLAKRTIHLPQDPLENNIEWRTRKQLESASTKDERYLLGRRMRVNGRNILSLDYSQNFRRENIYDDHTKFVLKIQYNDRGMPTLWMPNNGITPVNVTYDRLGHPVTWQRGPNHELLAYDEKGRITNRRTVDGATWTYLNQENVVQLSVPKSTSHYTYVYDDFENVRRVNLPSGAVFLVTRFMGTGFKRTVVQISAGSLKMFVDVDDRNNLLMQQYQGENRKVVYRYDTHGHMTEILHDKQKTRMLRDPRSGELVSMTTDDVTTRFHRNGPLVQTLIVTSSTATQQKKEISAKFEYSHDVNLRLKSIQTTINDTNLPLEEVRYDDVSGKITVFGLYSVLYYQTNLYVISTAEVTYTKEHDHSGRPVQVKLDIYSSPMFLLNVDYDAMGRVKTQNIRISMQSNNTELNYQYRPDGLLSLVTRTSGDSHSGWKYSYDKDGKISSIQSGSSIIRISYSNLGTVTSRGTLQYFFDKDGFFKSRGNEIFEYDSLGHLVAAYMKDGSYKVKYGYDGFGRLSSRFDEKSRQMLRFYYADISNPTRLTNYFNSTSGFITTLRYDMEGVLFALDMSNGLSWSVMCDHNGSPLAVIGSTGIIAEMSYSPYGELTRYTNPRLQIVIGYRGGIYDPDTGLVHFADRSMIQQSDKFKQNQKNLDETRFLNGVDYDPLIGQTTTPDYSVLLSKRENIPRLMKLYQVYDPVNPVPPYDQMTKVSSWLDALGFKLQNVAPDPKIDDRQKDKSSVECQLSHHLQTYINLQTVSPSSLIPETRKKTKQIANGALFAQGLVLSIDRGMVTTHVAGMATNDVKRLSSILNGGDVIIGKYADSSSAPMSFTKEGKPVLYISKSLDSLKADKVTLTLTDSKRILDGGYSGAMATSQTTQITVTVSDDILTIESPYCVVIISYVTMDNRNGKTRLSEEKRIVESARSTAEQEAWAVERQKVTAGERSRWNAREKQQLRRSGKVSGYKVEFFWDVDKYPEFASSGRNINFVRT
uniref:teneurin-3-like isoform X3 n=1 Tax=Styela clava TaxID=7725 RepID=UPI001939AAC5|nr:teneurin-3-like isoform X3 [Styela clava]